MDDDDGASCDAVISASPKPPSDATNVIYMVVSLPVCMSLCQAA